MTRGRKKEAHARCVGFEVVNNVVPRPESFRQRIAPTARAALTRPPVTTLPRSESSLSTVLKRRSRSSFTVRFGSTESTSAATPATKGVAIEVPECSSYAPSSQVLRISLPGAARWTLFAP